MDYSIGPNKTSGSVDDTVSSSDDLNNLAAKLEEKISGWKPSDDGPEETSGSVDNVNYSDGIAEGVANIIPRTPEGGNEVGNTILATSPIRDPAINWLAARLTDEPDETLSPHMGKNQSPAPSEDRS